MTIPEHEGPGDETGDHRGDHQGKDHLVVAGQLEQEHYCRGPAGQKDLAFGGGDVQQLPGERPEGTAGDDDRTLGTERPTRSDGHRSRRRLGKRHPLLLKHHSMVELVNRAEAAGMVVRHADPEDHRVVRVELSPKGRDPIVELSERHPDEVERLLPVLKPLVEGRQGFRSGAHDQIRGDVWPARSG